MATPKKIAVLVHNNVLRDARVRKQARTLVEAGHKVDVFGFSLDGAVYPSTIEGGARLKIEPRKIPNTLLKVFSVLSGLLTGSRVGRAMFALLILSLLYSLLVSIALVVLIAPWLAAPLIAVLALFVLGGLLCLAALVFKRQYIRDWVQVNWGFAAISRPLARNVIGKDYDVVHCHDMIAMMAGEMIKKQDPQITLIWDAHELYTELSYKTPYVGKLTGKMIARIAPRVDKMVTISPSFVALYAERYPKLPKAEVVMNATRRPTSLEVNRALLRDAAGVSADQKVLLFQGGVSHGRGVGLLLEAAAHMPKHWSLVFMGFGPMLAEVEATAAKLNGARPKDAPAIAVVPPAPQDVLRDWTSGADLGVIPYENTSLNHLYCTPNKLWEYPNARVPILATDLVEMAEIITQNGTGTLLPRDFTAADIVSALDRITEAQLETWRNNCDVFNETENWEKFEPNLLRAYA